MTASRKRVASRGSAHPALLTTLPAHSGGIVPARSQLAANNADKRHMRITTDPPDRVGAMASEQAEHWSTAQDGAQLTRLFVGMRRPSDWACARCGREREEELLQLFEQGGKTWGVLPCNCQLTVAK
jgi:hypothetical protein